MTARRVRQLRIRGDRPQRVGQAVVQLEDALRTASFGNLPRNGVVYIRRLDLGRVGPRPQSRQLSRRIDRALWALPASAIRHGSAETDLSSAEAVWFADPVSALTAVAERILRQRPLRAWYWRRVLDLPPLASVAVDLASVFQRAEAVVPAALTVMQLVRRIDELGALPRLVEQLPMAMLRRQLPWLEARVVSSSAPPLRSVEVSPLSPPVMPEPDPMQTLATYPVAQLSPKARATIAQLLSQWRSEPERIFWCILTLHQLEARPLSAGVWQSLRQQILQGDQPLRLAPQPPSQSPEEAESTTRLRGGGKAVETSASPSLPTLPVTRGEPAGGQGPDRDRVPGRSGGLPRQRRPFPDTDFDWAGNWLWGGRATPVAGLLFVLPIWQHLGLVTALEQQPWLAQARFPQLLLERLGEWLGLAEDEPMVGWMPAGDLRASGDWRCPVAWNPLLRDHLRCHPPTRRLVGSSQMQTALSGRVLMSLQGPWPLTQPMLRCLADSWLRLTARWLNRHGMRLRRLVERVGAVAVTETHIDICLPLEGSDLGIRRLGLDLDPGWLPWLGRVIQYHYLQREHADA